MSGDSVREIEKFRSDMLATRAQLRDVQYNMHRDVDSLKSTIKALDVGVLPALFAALAFALRRPRQSVPTKRSDA